LQVLLGAVVQDQPDVDLQRGQPVMQCHWRMDHWNAAAAALLAGTDGDLLPMSLALVGALALQLDLAALGKQRGDFADAQFDRLLNGPVHALATGQRLPEVGVQRRLGCTGHRLLQGYGHVALAHRADFARPFLTAAVEDLHGRAGRQTQHPADIVGNVAVENDLACGQRAIQIKAGYAHGISPGWPAGYLPRRHWQGGRSGPA